MLGEAVCPPGSLFPLEEPEAPGDPSAWCCAILVGEGAVQLMRSHLSYPSNALVSQTLWYEGCFSPTPVL